MPSPKCYHAASPCFSRAMLPWLPMACRAPYTIGYFDESRGLGGTTRYLLELLQGLDRSVFHAVFFALGPSPWHAQLAAKDVEIVLLEPETGSSVSSPAVTAGAGASAPPARKGRLPASIAWWLGLGVETRELVRLFRKRPVDLLHTNNTGAEPAPIAARLAGVPRILGVWHVDSSYDFGQRSSFRYRWLERRSTRS